MDRLPGRLEDGAGLLGRLRPPPERALRDPAPIRAVRGRADRLAPSPAGRQPRYRRPARLRRLALVLQPGRHRRLGSAPVPGPPLPVRARPLDRVAGKGRGHPAGLADRLADRRHPVPDRGPGRPQRRRRGDDRRRLRERRRRRPDLARRTALRQLPRRRLLRRHLRPSQLHRIRPLRGDLAVARDLGRPPGLARRRGRLRPGDDRAARPARAPDPTRPRGSPARRGARLRLGGLSLHRDAVGDQLERHPRRAAPPRHPPRPHPPGLPRASSRR